MTQRIIILLVIITGCGGKVTLCDERTNHMSDQNSMSWLPDNIEIVVEKDGQEVDALPEELKRDMEFLFDRGHNPDKQLNMANSCLPTVGGTIALDSEGDMEAQVRSAVLAVAREEKLKRSIVFDLKTLEELIVVERVLTKMKDFLEENGIRYLLTPRTRQRIIEIKRRREEFILANSGG